MTAAPEKIAVLSDGAWATALANLLARKGFPVSLWCQFPHIIDEIRLTGVNQTFLPGVKVHPGVTPIASMAQALDGAGMAVIAKPVIHLRAMMREAAPLLLPTQRLVSVSKGIENDTLLRAGEIVSQATGRDDVVLLLGPSHAEEVARLLPTSVVAAARNESLATAVQETFSTDRFRVYTTDDVVGVEIAACVKNVIAVAAGVVEGLGFGDNSKAALITRGLAEIRRLGMVLGARSETFSGLAGVGDLITTCVSPYGRNRRIGYEIGKGKTLRQALEDMAPAVPEGVWTCKSTVALASRHGVPMPIASEVHAVLFEDKPPLTAVSDLMNRAPRSEIENVR